MSTLMSQTGGAHDTTPPEAQKRSQLWWKYQKPAQYRVPWELHMNRISLEGYKAGLGSAFVFCLTKVIIIAMLQSSENSPCRNLVMDPNGSLSGERSKNKTHDFSFLNYLS